MCKRRFVLIVAVAQYADNQLPRLPGVHRDAERLRSVLERHAEGGVHRMYWLCDGNATKQDILKTLAEIGRQASATDQVLLYFAGHGWRDRDSTAKHWTYYLIPHDATFGSAAEKGISIEELQAMLGAVAAQELVLILDCCHSGGMANSCWTADTLEDLLQGWRSHYVMAASRGCDQAAEDNAGGFFTQALCDALRGEGVTPDGQGRISAQKAWAHAADLVRVRAARPNFQQVAVSSGISSPIYLTCVQRNLTLQRPTNALAPTAQPPGGVIQMPEHFSAQGKEIASGNFVHPSYRVWELSGHARYTMKKADLPRGCISVSFPHDPYLSGAREIPAYILRVSGVDSIRALLDNVYLGFLQDRFAPWTYGSQWVLACEGRRASRLVIPLDWLITTDKRQYRLDPTWATQTSPRAAGVMPGADWHILDPLLLCEDALGLAVNDASLIDRALLSSKVFDMLLQRRHLQRGDPASVKDKRYAHTVVLPEGARVLRWRGEWEGVIILEEGPVPLTEGVRRCFRHF
jgi:hypothetical protein